MENGAGRVCQRRIHTTHTLPPVLADFTTNILWVVLLCVCVCVFVHACVCVRVYKFVFEWGGIMDTATDKKD